MIATLRLDDCGDFLTFQQYCAWRGEAPRTVRRQIRKRTAFVMPREEKPRLKWYRTDCERAVANQNLVKERQRRANALLSKAS